MCSSGEHESQLSDLERLSGESKETHAFVVMDTCQKFKEFSFQVTILALSGNERRHMLVHLG